MDRQTNSQRKISFASVSLAEAVTDDLAYNPRRKSLLKSSLIFRFGNT